MAEIDLGRVVGRSAYECAAAQGFKGTEQEWIESLKGQDAEEYQILTSSSEVQENVEAGKLVDALVMKEVFQSVSEGKAAIASAITDKGVQTGAEDSFAVMAQNIGNIQTGSDGGGSSNASPRTYTLSYDGAFLHTSNFKLQFYFVENGIKKIIIKKLRISGKKGLNNAPNTSLYYRVFAKKDNVSTQVYYFSANSFSSYTSYTTTTQENIEIDLSEYDTADYIIFSTGRGSGTVYYYPTTISAEIEVYF